MADKKDQVTKATVTDTAPGIKAAKTKTAKETKPAAEKKTVDYKNGERGRLRARYSAEIVPALMKEKGYKNVNEVPALIKVVLNMRLGDIKDNSKSIQSAQKELDAIAGQRSVLVKAKKSVANFKLRENQPIGLKVTLRGAKAYEFFDKFVSVALPRVRDFRGVSGKSFDGRGNYATGVKEQIIFPEISYETVEKVRGFDVCIVTSARTDDEAKALLAKLGMPFKNEK
jgi:large subunit ribosomal protein L5